MYNKQFIEVCFLLVLTIFPLTIQAKSSFLRFFRTWSKFNRDNRAILTPKLYSFDKETLAVSSTKKVTFADVKGDIPREIQDLKEMLQGAYAFQRSGAQLPKGFLLVGPPGTGKTLLVRALAGELSIPFVCASGSEFVDLWVGNGPKKVRDLFQKARDLSKKDNGSYVILFIDELDAIGSREGHMNQEYTNTINQLLVEMDGFSPDENIIVIGATNHIKAIDSALKRAGRFDYIIELKLPDYQARFDMLVYYLTNPLFKRAVHADVDYAALAQKTAGCTGADIKLLTNQAAINAGRNKRKDICQVDLDQALATLWSHR